MIDNESQLIPNTKFIPKLFEIEEETHIHYSWLSTLLLNTRKAA